jgi:DNA-binding transcriptional regulator YhcF (GntR family)
MAENDKIPIEFHLDAHSGVPLYLQLVHQVKRALLLGFLVPGDQLPTMREVVSRIAINPNTVFKAYRELELEGLVSSRPGIGTFVERSLSDVSPADLEELRQGLIQWIKAAEEAGLDGESIEALFVTTYRKKTKRLANE